MDKIRVLLASNFALLRAGLHALLAECNNVEVGGECTVDGETLAQVRERQPSVLILEVARNDDATFALIETLAAQAPATRIVAVSTIEDSAFILRLLRVGVYGYLSHHEAAAELVRAVKAVAQGEVFLCPSASGALLTGYREQARARERAISANHC